MERPKLVVTPVDIFFFFFLGGSPDAQPNSSAVAACRAVLELRMAVGHLNAVLLSLPVGVYHTVAVCPVFVDVYHTVI